MQRDRWFASYEDLEARYETRPSVWVEPIGNWGARTRRTGADPDPDETNDNIVTYWVPQQPLRPGLMFEFRYRVLWQKATERRPPGWVVQTRRGQGYPPLPEDVIKFTVDFDGPALRKLPDDAPVTADLSVSGGGQQLALIVHKNDVTGGWRMVVRVRRTDKEKPIELRAVLRNGTIPMSETWSTIVPPA